MDRVTAPPAVRVSSDPAALAARALVVARSVALGVLGDREAAADIAQEVAVTAVRKASTLRDPAALDGWLHRIAVRAALAEARRGRHRRAAELAHVEDRARAEGPGLAGTAEPVRFGWADDHGMAAALALLDGLPARQRAALTLRYVHDLPDDAIARALRCRPGTVRSLLSRGREALRSLDPEISP
jgi:RNA polymerase sigma factor (sigma-70 family)